MRRRSLLVALSALVLAPFAARAEGTFAPLPPLPGEKAGNGLTARVVRYDGHTNGQMVVAVRNPSGAALAFDPTGLYFVPRVRANEAPQRLGAVGGFDYTDAQGKAHRTERVTVASGETVELHMDVYCIDSHRSSPGPDTPFRIAKERMPKQLVRDITVATKRAADANGGYAAPAAKGAVQQEVWQNRDKQWIRLDGEGAQELAK